MKSIEERAREYILTNANYIELPTRRWETSVRQQQDAYMAGATEQRVIDEEVRLKKCDDMTKAEYDREVAFAEWYHKNGNGTPTFSDAIEWARKDLLDKVCDWLGNYFVFEHEAMSAAGCDAFLHVLRKAMEE